MDIEAAPQNDLDLLQDELVQARVNSPDQIPLAPQSDADQVQGELVLAKATTSDLVLQEPSATDEPAPREPKVDLETLADFLGPLSTRNMLGSDMPPASGVMIETQSKIGGVPSFHAEDLSESDAEPTGVREATPRQQSVAIITESEVILEESITIDLAPRYAECIIPDPPVSPITTQPAPTPPTALPAALARRPRINSNGVFAKDQILPCLFHVLNGDRFIIVNIEVRVPYVQCMYRY